MSVLSAFSLSLRISKTNVVTLNVVVLANLLLMSCEDLYALYNSVIGDLQADKRGVCLAIARSLQIPSVV